jgi:hypothetical protein
LAFPSFSSYDFLASSPTLSRFFFLFSLKQ